MSTTVQLVAMDDRGSEILDEVERRGHVPFRKNPIARIRDYSLEVGEVEAENAASAWLDDVDPAWRSHVTVVVA